MIAFALLAFAPIEDTSTLSWKNPELLERKWEKIGLDNGLELLLIHDPQADQSAATISVQAGSWNDPQEYPGMAHFCEHMLFMGTEKYPDTNAFFSNVANFHGKTNAFTAQDRTVYFFSSQTDGFASLFDHFTSFFLCPLFDTSNIAREMHAVDQEFQLHKENDHWREYMVLKELANPEHPYHNFSTGNSQTLQGIPSDALRTWKETHYGAQNLKVAIYSSLPLEELRSLAIPLLEELPSSPPLASPSLPPRLSSEQKGQFLEIQSSLDRCTLHILWEIPPDEKSVSSAKLLSYALTRGCAHSLRDLLHEKHWIDDIAIDVETMNGNSSPFLEVEILLSEKGKEKIPDVLHLFFQALASIQKEGISKSLFLEKNQIESLTYQYQTRKDAFSYVEELGRTLHNEPLTSYPQKSLLLSTYSQESLQKIVELLRIENALVTLLSPEEKGYTTQETWLKTPYKIRPLAANTLLALQKSLPHPQLDLLSKNPYLPTSFPLTAQSDSSTPILFSQIPQGKAYYTRANEFTTPKSAIHLQIHSPEIDASPKGEILLSLLVDTLTDHLYPTLAAAAAGGLQASFDPQPQILHIEMEGFPEKMPLLLQEILHALTLAPPSEEAFRLSVERHKKLFSNGQKELPARQAKELLTTLLKRSSSTKKERLRLLQKIDYATFLSFYKNLFTKNYLEALFAGNLSQDMAESLFLDTLHHLAKTPYPPENHPPKNPLSLPPSLSILSQNTQAQGNATLLLLDEGDFSFEKRASQDLLTAPLHEAFFHTLRTKQKTGYLAAAQDIEWQNHLYHFFLVQSSTHAPQDLLYRFELFLEEYLEDFALEIPKSRFETLRKGKISTLQTRFRSLPEKARLWNKLAFDLEGDFTFIDKRIQALEALDYPTFEAHTREFLSRANRKRLALLFSGTVESPFAYTHESPLSDIVRY